MPSPTFPPQALTFFRQLAKNNSRDWFQPRKEQFEKQVREPMIALLNHLCDTKGGLCSFAADYIPTDPKKVLYRIYRDTRFSKDKTPYKTHIAAHFQHGRIEKNRGAGYYFGVSHEGVEVGAGLYMPDKEQLAAVRTAIAERPEELRKILTQKKLVALFGAAQGDRAKRTPAPFAADDPAADLLSLKQIYFFQTLPAKLATDMRLAGEILSRFRAAEPFITYVNNAIVSDLESAEVGVSSRPKRPEPMF